VTVERVALSRLGHSGYIADLLSSERRRVMKRLTKGSVTRWALARRAMSQNLSGTVNAAFLVLLVCVLGTACSGSESRRLRRPDPRTAALPPLPANDRAQATTYLNGGGVALLDFVSDVRPLIRHVDLRTCNAVLSALAHDVPSPKALASKISPISDPVLRDLLVNQVLRTGALLDDCRAHKDVTALQWVFSYDAVVIDRRLAELRS
jgi:hypothetical protein